MGNIFHKLAKKILYGSATDAERRFMDIYYDAFDNIKGREDASTTEEQAIPRNHIDQGIQNAYSEKATSVSTNGYPTQQQPRF